MIFRLIFWFVMVLMFVGLLKIKFINGVVGCIFKYKNYMVCIVMINFVLILCNGSDCLLGF